MGNKVYFGLSNVHIAICDENFDQGKPLYETPIKIKGSVKLSLNADSEENIFYADNISYYVVNSDNGFKGDLEVAKFEDELLSQILGWEIDEIGGLIQTTNGINKSFALGGQIEGDVRGRRFWLYYCTGTKPNSEYETNQKGISVKTQTMSIVTLPLDLGRGEMVTKYSLERTNESKEIYDSFFNEVYVPGVSEVNVFGKRNVVAKNSKGIVIGGY